MRRWSLVLPGVVLGLTIGAQFLGVFREVPRPRAAHLAQAVPVVIPGWTGRDVPLGATEFISNEVEKVLNYDEVVNREYSRAGERIGVYMAYWSPGKMPTRFVASHTPDRCWTENGWRCLAMKFKQAEPFEGGLLKPAEWRIFEPPRGGSSVYVLYWHLVDGRPYDYGERFNDVPSPLLWWKDAMQQVVSGSREQYFIRLTSNEPWENVWSDPGLRDVLRGLGELGLAAADADRTQDL